MVCAGEFPSEYKDIDMQNAVNEAYEYLCKYLEVAEDIDEEDDQDYFK